MSKKWAIFDMDDVVTHFADSCHKQLVLAGYPDIPVSAWNNYEIDKIYGVKSHDEFKKLMIDLNMLEKAEIKIDAIDVFQSFKDNGFHVGILTARGWHPYAQSITEEYCKVKNLPVDKIVIAGAHTQPKVDFSKEFLKDGEILSYIDDSVSHVKDFLHLGIPTFLMKTSWIKDTKGLPTVDSLTEFRNHIFDIYDIENKFKISHRNKP